jgi:hypothetical protein
MAARRRRRSRRQSRGLFDDGIGAASRDAAVQEPVATHSAPGCACSRMGERRRDRRSHSVRNTASRPAHTTARTFIEVYRVSRLKDVPITS